MIVDNKNLHTYGLNGRRFAAFGGRPPRRRSYRGFTGFGAAVGDSCTTDTDCGCSPMGGCCYMGQCISVPLGPAQEGPASFTVGTVDANVGSTQAMANLNTVTGTTVGSSSSSGGSSGGSSWLSSLFSSGNAQGAGQIITAVGNATRGGSPSTSPAGSAYSPPRTGAPPKKSNAKTYAVVGVAALVAGVLILS